MPKCLIALVFSLLLLLGLSSCQSVPLALSPTAVRLFYSQSLYHFWQEEYAAYQEKRPSNNAPPDQQAAVGETSAGWFLYPYRLDRSQLSSLPPNVQFAFDYYFQAVEAADWGNVYLYALEIAGNRTYAVRVTTDGDDGWLEIFDGGGRLLAAGRTYIELVAWGDQATIRQQVKSGEFPDELRDRTERTFWGKP